MKKILTYIKVMKNTAIILWKSSSWFLIANIIFSLFQGIFIPVNIYIWKNVIDEITKILIGNNHDFSALCTWLFYYFVIFVISNIVSNISQYIQVIYSEYISAYINDIIISKSLRLEMIDFDNNELYNEINKASNESSNRSLQILQTFMQLIQNLTSLSGVATVLLIFNYNIVILCFLATIPMFYISCKIMDQLYEIYNKRFEKLRFASVLKELLIKNENIKEIKVFKIGNYIKEKILGVLYQNIEEDKVIRKKILIKNTFATIIDNIFLIIIKLIILYLSIIRQLTIGMITMYINSVDTLKNTIQNILSLISSSYEHSLYMNSIFHILNEKDREAVNINNITSINEICFEDVSFKYPYSDRYILKNINLKFKKNQSYALVGLNGAGKTTLIKLILNLYEPTKGNILVNGINIREINREVYFGLISAVFQDFIKYPFDVKTNIGLGNIEKINDINIIKKAAEFSELDDFINTLPNKYSTLLQKGWENSTEISIGQWQKIAISRAMMKPSNLIILDEPTASLDADAEYELFHKFKQMQLGKISILVSHRFSSLSLADQIIVISDNEILEFGTHDELMKNGKEYKRLYQLQSDMYKRS